MDKSRDGPEDVVARDATIGWASRVVRQEGVQGLGVGVIRPGLARVHRAVRLAQRHPRVHHVICPPLSF